MSLLFTTERQVAITAVRRACGLTSAVFNNLVKNETLIKGDRSPVTGESLSCIFVTLLIDRLQWEISPHRPS